MKGLSCSSQCHTLGALIDPVCDIVHGQSYTSLCAATCSSVSVTNLQRGACTIAGVGMRALTDMEDEEKGETFADAHSSSYIGVLFLFFGLALGAATTHFMSRYLHGFPYTCMLLIEGIVLSIIHEASHHGLGLLSDSLEAWIDIDPDLLLDAFLPALVFGDIMNINIHGAKRSMWECFVLACPGVLIGTVLIAVSAKLIFPYGWTWALSLTVGAILSATDPVAVTALMKEVGADPRLTMVIGGESLMNDGTAIVVFKLFYHLHRGASYNIAEVTEFFLRMSVAGPLLGMAFGLVGRTWISWASRKEELHDSTVQIIVTICTAYLTFFVSEHVCNVSGVLATCAAAMVLAGNIWPKVCNHDTMEHVWHTIEYVGNTLIFLLAGLIIGNVVYVRTDVIHARDFLHLLAFFLSMTVARLVMIVFLQPLVKMDRLISFSTKDSVAQQAAPNPNDSLWAIEDTAAMTAASQMSSPPPPPGYRDRRGSNISSANRRRSVSSASAVGLPGEDEFAKEPLINNWSELFFMTWAGLRGAVGLALAIVVDSEDDTLDHADSSRVVFMVGGVVALSLLVQGTTSGAMLEWLGLAEESPGKAALLRNVVRRINQHRSRKLDALSERELGKRLEQGRYCFFDVREANKFCPPFAVPQLTVSPVNSFTVKSLRQPSVLEKLRMYIEESKYCGFFTQLCAPQEESSSFEDDSESLTPPPPSSNGLISLENRMRWNKIRATMKLTPHRTPKQRRGSTLARSRSSPIPLHEQPDWEDPTLKKRMLVCVREVFLHVLKQCYWQQIKDGGLPEDSTAALLLLASVDQALERVENRLEDWEFLEPYATTTNSSLSCLDAFFKRNADQKGSGEGGLPTVAQSPPRHQMKSSRTPSHEGHFLPSYDSMRVYAQQEQAFYIATSFISAHITAQEMVTDYFGIESTSTTMKVVENDGVVGVGSTTLPLDSEDSDDLAFLKVRRRASTVATHINVQMRTGSDDEASGGGSDGEETSWEQLRRRRTRGSSTKSPDEAKEVVPDMRAAVKTATARDNLKPRSSAAAFRRASIKIDTDSPPQLGSVSDKEGESPVPITRKRSSSDDHQNFPSSPFFRGHTKQGFTFETFEDRHDGCIRENTQYVEEETIITESEAEVRKAQAVLEKMHPKLKSEVQSKQVAGMVLREQYRHIETMAGQGLLTPKEANAMFGEIAKSTQLMAKARNRARRLWRFPTDAPPAPPTSPGESPEQAKVLTSTTSTSSGTSPGTDVRVTATATATATSTGTGTGTGTGDAKLKKAKSSLVQGKYARRRASKEARTPAAESMTGLEMSAITSL